jgi:hypothetical protein
MKSVSAPVVAAILALVGCSSVETQDSPEDRLTKMEIQLTTKIDKEHALVSELTEEILRLKREITRLDNENQMLKIDLKRLGERIDQAGSSGTRSGPPAADLSEIGMKIDQALAKLRTTGNDEEAAQVLVPLARYSAPKMAEAMKQVASPEYLADLEKVLAKCPPSDLKAPLEEAAKDRVRRTSAARVVGATGDKELSRILEPWLGDPDPSVQVEVGQALIACKNRMGVPPLLKALAASESEIRFRAILSLKRLNKGETYGYDMNKSADDNAAALKAWEAWWAKEPKLFE